MPHTYWASLIYPDYHVEIGIPVKAEDGDDAARIFFTARQPRLPAFFFVFRDKSDTAKEGRLYHARIVEDEVRLTIAYDRGKHIEGYWPGLESSDPKEFDA